MDPEVQPQDHLERAFYYYEETEAFEEALAECEAALELDPLRAEAHNLRGMILEELDRPLEALGAYQEALRLEPDLETAQENLAALKAEFAALGSLVTIATFSFPTEAYIPKTRLESEGIWAFVADAETVTMNWLYSNAIGGVRLQVRAADVDKALEVLNREPEPIEWEEAPAGEVEETEEVEEAEEVTCPKCGSSEVEYERYATRLVFLSWLLLSVPLPFLKRKWKCRQCGHSWRG